MTNDIICLNLLDSTGILKYVGIDLELILSVYNRLLKPYNVKKVCTIKHGIRKKYLNWASFKYINLSSLKSFFFSPDCKDICTWLSVVWDVFWSKSICNTFEHVWFTNKDILPPKALFPAIALPHVTDSDMGSIDGEDLIEITEQ